jgi:hypothetical protein
MRDAAGKSPAVICLPRVRPADALAQRVGELSSHSGDLAVIMLRHCDGAGLAGIGRIRELHDRAPRNCTPPAQVTETVADDFPPPHPVSDRATTIQIARCMSPSEDANRFDNGTREES